MKCMKCGKELPLSAKFCTNCGEPVPEIPVASEVGGADDIPMNDIGAKGSKPVSAKDNLKSNWNDKYTILVIIAVMVIAAIAGLIVKKAGQKKENENSYDYDYGYEEDYSSEDDYGYEEDYSNEDDYGYENEEGYVYEDDFSYEEDSYEEEHEEASKDYILPDSSTRFLTKSDLYGLSAEECRIARNEIYARHGRMFNDETLQAYFESFAWYYPTIHPDDFEESMLNEYELENRDLIVEYETEQGYR